jgi:dTDP-4-amino-4,6-dideoxygalactose transaminase
MDHSVPFNKPSLIGNELIYLKQAIENGHVSGDGEFTRSCHKLLEDELGCSKVLLTTSCTHALEMAALLLECKAGDEVIVPSFTFVTTINSFVLHGATPVFCDIHPDTLNLDESKLGALITHRTKAIVPVHYAGVSCNMDNISRIAGQHGITIVEDNAHGLFSRYRGKYTGTFGALATQSFHETKNFTCGEGGALILNEPGLIERALVIREKGTNRSRFFRGMVDKYTWVDVGSSYLPSDMLAAFLLGQLEQRFKIQAKRRAIWEYYRQNLTDWAEENSIRLPLVPNECEQSYHMFYLLMPSLDTRTNFIQHLKGSGIMAVFHYLPLHLSDMGMKFGGRRGDCPVTEDISDRLVRLPFYYSLSRDEQEFIIATARTFFLRR